MAYADQRTLTRDQNEVADRVAHAAGYSGRKIRLRPADRVNLDSTWAGGSRSTFTGIQLLANGDGATFRATAFPLVVQSDPETFGGESRACETPAGILIVERVTWRGRDLGIVVHASPSDFAILYGGEGPAVVLDLGDWLVLAITESRISRARRDCAGRHGISPRQWLMRRPALVARGLLRANGAITPAGSNAVAESAPAGAPRI